MQCGSRRGLIFPATCDEFGVLFGGEFHKSNFRAQARVPDRRDRVPRPSRPTPRPRGGEKNVKDCAAELCDGWSHVDEAVDCGYNGRCGWYIHRIPTLVDGIVRVKSCKKCSMECKTTGTIPNAVVPGENNGVVGEDCEPPQRQCRVGVKRAH